MVEWSNQSRYNSFNSYKGLAYYEFYKSLVLWMDGKGELPPPVEVNLDPIAACNLRCYFCNSQRYLKVGETRELPIGYILELVGFLAQWGVKGLCISGGGDPSLHPRIHEAVLLAQRRGLQISFVTNCVHLPLDLLNALMACRWVGVSVNAATRETYHTIMGRDYFDKAVNNLKSLVEMKHETGSRVDIGCNMLILPENVGEIYQTCRLAKKIGAQDFHLRPADLERKDYQGKLSSFDIADIEKQFALCHEETTEDFRVFTTTHKFAPDLRVMHQFKQCLASPLILPILSDGNAYLCVDHKMEQRFRLGSGQDILKWWGSDKHRQLIKGVNVEECSRCTLGEYNRQIEDAVILDGMCLAFP